MKNLYCVLLLLFLFVLNSGCSSNIEWERWEYLKVETSSDEGIIVHIKPTRYGARNLSSTGPFRLFVYEIKNCNESHFQLRSISIESKSYSKQLSTESALGITKMQYDGKCVFTFASDEKLELDYQNGEDLSVTIDYVINSNSPVSKKVIYRFQPQYTNGETRIPLITT